MDLARRRAAGELSALFGAAALGADREGRVHRFRARAGATLETATSEARATLLAELRQRHRLSSRFVLGVGYDPRKNIPLLIDAFARIASRHLELGLVVVAAREDRRDHFHHLAAWRGLGERVTVLGAVPVKDLVGLYNAADAFVFPSEREGFGLPPLEAMACGAPTIAMNATSLPEVIGNGGML